MIAEGEQIQHEPWRSLQRRVAPSVREDLDHALDRRLKESLEALKAYLMTTITRRDEAVAFLRMLGPVRALCNTDIYELPMAAEAYAYTHFPTRYVRWWKVLHLLFQSGWLPMRQDGINAMDVGSGPAPATYALIDFLASLGEAVSTTPRNLGAQRLRTDTPRLTLAEKSRTMGHLVHLLSEHRTLAGPYHISVPDFFGVRLIRTKERNAETRQELINELMSDWDDMAYEEASFILKEEYPNWHEPARFHLCMVSYLLTTEGALNLAGQALNELKRTLPPGGTIVVMGGLDEDYARIHARLGRKLRGLHRLDIELPFSLTLTDAQQDLIKQFYLDIGRHVRNLVGKEEADMVLQNDKYLRDLWNPNKKIPRATFAVEAFRAPDNRGAAPT